MREIKRIENYRIIDEGLELILGVAYRYTGEQLAVLKDELEDDWEDITEED